MNVKFLVIGICLFLLACIPKKETKESVALPDKIEAVYTNDSSIISIPISTPDKQQKNIDNGKKYLIYREEVFQKEDYEIKYIMFENGDGIMAEHYYENGDTILHRYEDISLLLIVKKNGQEFINRQIHKNDFKEFVPEEIRNIMTFVSFYYESSTPVSISFTLNLCQPDTDFCFSFEIIFLETGEMITNLLPEEPLGD